MVTNGSAAPKNISSPGHDLMSARRGPTRLEQVSELSSCRVPGARVGTPTRMHCASPGSPQRDEERPVQDWYGYDPAAVAPGERI
jgi:hypothetical protein